MYPPETLLSLLSKFPAATEGMELLMALRFSSIHRAAEVAEIDDASESESKSESEPAQSNKIRDTSLPLISQLWFLFP